METLARILREHPFFAGLKAEYIDLIAGCAANVRFDAREHIFREGEPANRFYLLRAGKVALQMADPRDGREPITVQTLTQGDILGWSWLVPPYRWRFDARTVDDVRAFSLDGACLRAKCEEDHDLGYELLKRFAQIMAERLQATRIHSIEMYNALSDAMDGMAVAAR